jgi:hypothetical protein
LQQVDAYLGNGLSYSSIAEIQNLNYPSSVIINTVANISYDAKNLTSGSLNMFGYALDANGYTIAQSIWSATVQANSSKHSSFDVTITAPYNATIVIGHETEPGLCDGLSEAECGPSSGCYWYNGKCNGNPPSPPIPWLAVVAVIAVVGISLIVFRKKK